MLMYDFNVFIQSMQALCYSLVWDIGEGLLVIKFVLMWVIGLHPNYNAQGWEFMANNWVAMYDDKNKPLRNRQ